MVPRDSAQPMDSAPRSLGVSRYPVTGRLAPSAAPGAVAGVLRSLALGLQSGTRDRHDTALELNNLAMLVELGGDRYAPTAAGEEVARG